MKTPIQKSILGLLVFMLTGISVQSQTPTTWSMNWSGNQFAVGLGSYLRTDPDNGTPWICLSHTATSGGVAYMVLKPGYVNRSTRVTVRVYGYDDGSGSGTQVGIYNFRSQTTSMLFTLKAAKAWYSASTSTDIGTFAGPADSVRVVIASAAADHGHIRGVELVVEYVASPPDLTPTELQLSDIVRAFPGETLDGRLKVTIKNRGGTASGAFSFGLYISPIWRVTKSDRLLVNGKVQIVNIDPDGEFILSPTLGIQIPSDLTPGGYYLGVIVDGDSLVTEADETNNSRMIPITINYGCGELLLCANFNAQSPGERPDSSLPGGPIGDSIYYSQTNRFGGLITIQDSLFGFPNHAAIIRLTSPATAVMNFACANPQGLSHVRVSLWLTLNKSGGISLLDDRQRVIASLSPGYYSGMSYCGGKGCISLPQTMSGFFEFSIDFDRKTTSLSMGGVPITAAQGVPFSDTSSRALGAVCISAIRTTYDVEASYVAFDDLIAESAPASSKLPIVGSQPCPGADFVIQWPSTAGVTSHRLYENHAVLWEGNAASLILNRPSGTFVYALQEKDGCGWTGLSDSIKVLVKSAPDTPDGLGSSQDVAAPGQLFTISWDSVPAATYYQLYEGSLLMKSSAELSCNFSYSEVRDYRFTVKACSPCGCSQLSRPLVVAVQNPTDVIEPANGRPKEFSLSQNFPNPFNPSTRIDFDLPLACGVSLEIFNVLGQDVRTLIDGPMAAGTHSIAWDARNDYGVKVSSGVYMYKLSAGKFVQSRKMLLLK